MFDIQESLIHIKKKIAEWDSLIKANTAVSMYDINILSENFCRDILNEIFSLKLINANLFEKNAKAIDLLDEKKKIVVQVTSDISTSKINHTIKEYVNNNYHHLYKELKIIVLRFDPKNKKTNYDYKDFSFNRKNIYYFDDIINLIDNCDLKNIFTIRNYFEEEYIKFKFKSETQKLKQQIETEKLLKQNIVERKLIKSTDKEEYFWYDKKNITVEELMVSSNNAVILGEAASGKSTYLKWLADYLNVNSSYFAIYYKLNLYTNEEIINIIPEEYNIIEKEKIVFILDGLDEIEEQYKKDFIKKIKKFNSRYIKTKIIISCRNNFYKTDNGIVEYNLENFDEYLLTDFNNAEVYEFLKLNNIDYELFIKKTEEKEYGSIIYSPFYLDILVSFYINNIQFPPKNKLLDAMIKNHYEKDIKKYQNTPKITEIQKRQQVDVQKLGFILECSGKNYIDDCEIKSFISKKDYQYLNCCSLLEFSNGKWSFIHNNFGEYLAALELEKYNKHDLFKIILINRNKKVKKSWYNTIAFYMMNNKKTDIIEYILDYNPDLVFNVEKDKIADDKKTLLFNKIIDYYMKKNIWIPSEYLYNNRFIEFFSTKEIYKNLCNIIKENNHYVKVHNALAIMIEMVTYIKDDTIFIIINELLYSNKYNKYDKKNALYILGNGKYGNENYIKKIIKDLKKTEDQYIRTGYFYYINRMNLVDFMINDILNYKSIVGKMVVAKWKNDDDIDDDSVTLIDEHIEFSKIFRNIKQKESIEKIIRYLQQDENRKEKFDDQIIINLCFSIENLNVSEDIKDNFLFELNLIFLDKFNVRNGNNILKIIDKRKKRLAFFDYYICNSEKVKNLTLAHIINKDCLSYIIQNSDAPKYSNDLLKKVLLSIPSNTKGYDNLRKIYEDRTNDVITPSYIPIPEKVKEKMYQECFNSIFDKTDFEKLIINFFEILNMEEIKIDNLFSFDFDHTLWDNVKFKYIEEILYQSYQDKEKTIKKKDIANIISKCNWDYFLIEEVVKFLENHPYIIINEEQIEKINNICNKWLKEVDFKTAITYTSSTSSSINIKCLRLAYLRKKLQLKFHENVLLDMLEFVLIENGQCVELDDLVNEIGYDKSKERILNNLSQKELNGEVLENHLKFCIKYSLFFQEDKIYEYFMSEKISPFNKRYCIEYLIKSNNSFYINKIFSNFNYYSDELSNQILYYINEYGSSNHILDIINRNFREVIDEKLKMSLCSIMIKNNKIEGVKFYYSWLKKNRKSYNDREMNKCLSYINNIRFILINFKILQLTFNDNFQDTRFNSIQNNIKKSIINIAKKNMFSNYLILFLIKLFMFFNRKHQYIGFMNYVLIEIEESKICDNNNMTTKEIKRILK